MSEFSLKVFCFFVVSRVSPIGREGRLPAQTRLPQPTKRARLWRVHKGRGGVPRFKEVY